MCEALELRVVCARRSFTGLEGVPEPGFSAGPAALHRRSPTWSAGTVLPIVYMPRNACSLLHAWVVNSRTQVRRGGQVGQVWKSRCSGGMMTGSSIRG